MKIIITILFFCFCAIPAISDDSINNSKDFFEHRRNKIIEQLKEALDFNKMNQENIKYMQCNQISIDDSLLQKIDNQYSINNLNKGKNYVNFDMDCVKKGHNSIYIRICDSPSTAYQNIVSLLSSIICYSNKMMAPPQAIPPSSDYHIGDYCAYSPGDYIVFCRANVGIVVFSTCRKLSDFYLVVKPFDEHIKSCLEPYDTNPSVQRVEFVSDYINNKKTNNTYIRKQNPFEVMEQQLKSMTKEEAQKQCLKKAMELSETPDKNAEELLFYLRGLPMVEEDGTTRVLHRISGTATDRKLLESAMQLQGKWLSLCSEPRKGVLDDLSRMLESDDSRLRRQAIVSLGRSGSLDALPPLFLELEKHPDDREVMSALRKILGWSEDGASLNEEQVKALKEQASELLKSLMALRGFASETEK